MEDLEKFDYLIALSLGTPAPLRTPVESLAAFAGCPLKDIDQSAVPEITEIHWYVRDPLKTANRMSYNLLEKQTDDSPKQFIISTVGDQPPSGASAEGTPS